MITVTALVAAVETVETVASVDEAPALPATTAMTTPASGTLPVLSCLCAPGLTLLYSEHEKQAAKGWGETTGEGEWNDEKAGEAIANAEAKDDAGFTPDTSGADPAFSNGPGANGEVVGEDAAPAEPEEKTMSYDEYLAQQAEKRLALSGNTLETRKANEGSKQKFPEGTAIQRSAEQENFISPASAKAKKEKENKAKDLFVLEGQYYAAPDSGDRGGRGGRGRGSGGRGRGGGEFRGDRERGGRGGRGRGESRGGFRGDRGGERGGDRAPRGGSGAFNANDQSAFPALGGA